VSKHVFDKYNKANFDVTKASFVMSHEVMKITKPFTEGLNA